MRRKGAVWTFETEWKQGHTTIVTRTDEGYDAGWPARATANARAKGPGADDGEEARIAGPLLGRALEAAAAVKACGGEGFATTVRLTPGEGTRGGRLEMETRDDAGNATRRSFPVGWTGKETALRVNPETMLKAIGPALQDDGRERETVLLTPEQGRGGNTVRIAFTGTGPANGTLHGEDRTKLQGCLVSAPA